MNLTEEYIAYASNKTRTSACTDPDKSPMTLIANTKQKNTVKRPIIMGTNQYAQSDLFLYPLQTAKKNNPGINATCPKIW